MENKLREIRKKCGYTQKQVAELMGLKCEDRISHWEKGVSNPSISNFLKLAKIYKVHPSDIYSNISFS